MTAVTSPNRPHVVLLTAALVVAALYFGRPLLAPMAVALLLVFLLAPGVDWLQKRGLPAPAPVILVMLTLIGAVTGVGVLVLRQSQALVEQLPQYESNIREKLTFVRNARKGPLSEEAKHALTELGAALEDEPADGSVPTTPVTVVEPELTMPERLAILAAPLTTIALTLVITFFMLLQRRSLRDRALHMFGRRHLSVTTRALEDAAQRISRYLMVQGLLNLGFGVVVTLGLYAIGLDFAPLWGLLAALLRFIPYAGPWIAGALPAALSLATAPGWTQPLLVVGLFSVTELINNMVLEPLLYGRTAGVSPVALVVTVAFWTLIWGPVGLFVATPLTVCLAVLCRHVPQLRFIGFLLSNEEVADDDAKYYQRLLAHDEDEALQIALQFAREHPVEQVYDELLLPAISALKADRVHEDLGDEMVRFGVKATRHIAEAVDGTLPPVAGGGRPLVLACPAADDMDVLALEMLRQLVLRAGRCDLEVLGSELLVSEVLAHAVRTRPTLVCIGSLAPGGLSRARLLCRRLRAVAPHTRIIAGRWRSVDVVEEARVLIEAGADRTSFRLQDTLRDIESLGLLAQPA